MQRARKNKRGDRGSTEEETSTAKKSNMATVKKVSKANASIQKELVKAKEELEQTKQQLDKEKEETGRVWCALDDLEQYTRKNSLEIHLIPEHVYYGTESAVIKIANALDVSIQPDDIEITHKLKGREGKRPIIQS